MKLLSIPVLLGILLLPLSLPAQKKLGEAVTLESVEIKGAPVPGSRVIAVAKFKLDKGFHVHSNKPSQPEFIATVLKVGEARGAKAGTISYPEGKSEKVEGLEKPLSVFEDHFEISVPIGLSGTARLPLTIPATLNYQACKGAQCYRPFDLKFDIPIGEKK